MSRPALRTAFWLALALGPLACQDAHTTNPPTDAPTATQRSSSILHDPATDTLFLASPDDDTLVVLDAQSLDVLNKIDVGQGPHQLAISPTAVIVAHRFDHRVARVDRDTWAVEMLAVPCGETGAVVTQGESLWVTCPRDDRVIRIDLENQHTTQWPLRRPTTLATGPSQISIATDGRLLSWTLPLPSPTLDPEPLAVLDTPLLPRPDRTPSQLRGLTLAQGDPVAVLQLVDNDFDRGRPPEAGSYGAVHDGDPRIEPFLAGTRCDGRYAAFDGGARVFSGPSGVAIGSDALAWISHQYTNNVAVLACPPGRDALVRRATFEVGAGPAGIAVSPDGRSAWVDVAFDYAVARLDLDTTPQGGVGLPTLVKRRQVTTARYSAQALEGRRLFHDATRVQLTAAGVVTCASCHPDGDEDGLVWFVHTQDISPKARRTPPAWTGRPDLAPFHWDGAFASTEQLVGETLVKLMQGTGALVDAGAFSAYMAERPFPNARPSKDASDSACRSRGEDVFAAAGCEGCHPSPLFSDGQAHGVRADIEDPHGLTEPVQTPSLIGVRGRAPWFHDGSSATLRQLLVEDNRADLHGATSGLSTQEIEDLVCYLEAL